MGGKGPPPLPDAQLARPRGASRGRTRVLAPTAPRRRVPALPPQPDGRPWEALTVAWWRDVWASPMAAEYLASDGHGLLILATLVDDFWRAPTAELAREIRLQRAAYGLSPVDRLRLRWETAKVDEAQRRAVPAARRRRAGDVRDVLTVLR